MSRATKEEIEKPENNSFFITWQIKNFETPSQNFVLLK